jgi:hypothetical protein
VAAVILVSVVVVNLVTIAADPQAGYSSGHLVSCSIRRATPLILAAVGQVRARAARS